MEIVLAQGRATFWHPCVCDASRDSDRIWQYFYAFAAYLFLASQWIAAAQDNGDQLRVGVLPHFPPHYLTNQQTDAPDGFAVDIMAAIAERVGIDVDYVVFENWPDLMQALRDEAVDVILNLGITPDREEWADFTAPVETVPISLFVRSTRNDIRGVDDLPGHRVSVVEANVGVRLMEERQHTDLNIHESLDEALLTLLSGHSEALIYPRHVLTLLARESGLEERVKVMGEPLLEIKRAIAVSKGDQELLARLDQAVRETVGSEIYREIFAKWYGTPKPFWDLRKALMAMAAVMVFAIIALVAWRYRTIVALNKRLAMTISEKEQAQNDLLLHRQAIEATDNGIMITDPRQEDNPVVYANPAIAQMTGYAVDEVIGRNPRILQGEDRDQPELEEIGTAIGNQQPIGITLRNYRKDGSLFLVDLQIAPVHDDAGEVTHFIGIQRDITERKQIERELQESHALYSKAARLARLGHYIWDEVGNSCAYCSPEVAEIFGVTVEEFLRFASSVESPIRWIHPEDRESYFGVISDAVRSGTGYETSVRILRDDGEIRHLHELGDVVFDSEGRVIQTIGVVQDVTELKQATSALQESEKRFRDFTEAASDWFWETGPDLRFTYVSSRVTDVSGMHPEEYIGKLRTEVPGNLEENTDWQQHVRDLETRQPFRDFTYARQLSDGQIRRFRTSGIPVFDDDGRFLGYRGTGSDITAEIEREQRERTAETRLARAVEAVPAAFALFDADDRLVMCNQRQRDAYETDLAPLEPGARFEDLARAIAKGGKIGETPDDAKAWLAFRLDRKNNPANGYTFKLNSGRWVSLSDQFLPDDSSITLAIDVTDLKQSEEAVREQEERLRSIIETAPDAIITIDDHGIINTFSRHAEEMFGYQASEMIGQNVKVLMPSPDREEHDGHLAHYRETGDKKIIGVGREVMAQRKDGSTYPVHLAVNEMMIEGHQMFTGVLRDMTEEKARDEQLRQAQKMEAIGQLTGGVAHDFNNLLTAIIGNLEMLEAWHGGDERSEKAISQAQEAAGLGAELTGRLLAFARRQPLDPKKISLSDMVLDMSDLLTRTLGETIEVNTVLANPLDRALVDPTQARNALLNLAINARDAMPKGGQLTIETANVELDEDYAGDHADVIAGHYVLLSVSDTGTGMPPEIRDRVFEPFFTTKDVGKGSGLGLSMVYGFIRQSGGHVRLYSEEGQGTAISVYFPKAEDTDSVAEEPRATAEVLLARRETVLVVEDDPRVRQVTIQRMQTLGYTVLEADNGQTALDLLADASAVDLVFTDVVMPGGMSGSDLAKEIHRLYPGIKVLLTSGYSEHAGIENDAAADQDQWLRKPYKMAELAQKVRDVLEGQ